MADKTVIVIQPVTLAWLEERGAEGGRGRSRQNPSVVLEMYLRHFRALLTSFDPRKRGLSETAIAAVVDLLDDPASLSPYEIQTFPEFLAHLGKFPKIAAQHGWEPTALEKELDSLSHGESLWLLDRALLDRAARQRQETASPLAQ